MKYIRDKKCRQSAKRNRGISYFHISVAGSADDGFVLFRKRCAPGVDNIFITQNCPDGLRRLRIVIAQGRVFQALQFIQIDSQLFNKGFKTLQRREGKLEIILS